MKSKKLSIDRDVSIARNYWDVPLRVGLVPYVRFSEELDDQLEQLVERWSHMAAPHWHASRKPK